MGVGIGNDSYSFIKLLLKPKFACINHIWGNLGFLTINYGLELKNPPGNDALNLLMSSATATKPFTPN
jgi:hypothetical protein